MNIFAFYIYLFFYMIVTLFYQIKLTYLKRHATKEEVDYYRNKTVSGWARNVLEKAGVKVSVEGNENLPDGNCLFISNHQGNFDFLAMLGYVNKPTGFLAKKEILKIPIIRLWMKEINCVFINRESPRKAVRSLKKSVKSLENGHSLTVFPEGTRSRGPNMGKFKRGSLKIAENIDVPIVPITVNGSYKIFEDYNGKKVVPGEIKMIIDKPIYFKELSAEEQDDFLNIIYDIIKNNLDNM